MRTAIQERNAAGRFLDVTRAGIERRDFGGRNLTPDGVRSLLTRYERAMVVAKTVVRLGDPIDPDDPAIEAFMAAEEQRARWNAPDLDETDIDAVRGDARHVVGVAIGLLLADRLA
jgi:hypothetical protein